MKSIKLTDASILTPIFFNDYALAVVHLSKFEDTVETKVAPPAFMQIKSKIEQSLRKYNVPAQALLYVRYNKDESVLHAWMNWNGESLDNRGVRLFLSRREQKKLNKIKKKFTKEMYASTNKTLNTEHIHA